MGLRREFSGVRKQVMGLRREFSGDRTEQMGLHKERTVDRKEQMGLRTEQPVDRTELMGLRPEQPVDRTEQMGLRPERMQAHQERDNSGSFCYADWAKCARAWYWALRGRRTLLRGFEKSPVEQVRRAQTVRMCLRYPSSRDPALALGAR